MIWQLKEVANGQIIATGHQRLTQFDSTAAWIAKLNRNGDVLWERFYLYDNGNDSLFDYEATFRGDFVQTPDGGFAIAGNVWKANASSPNLFFEQFWLVKLDSNGCMGLNDCGLYTGIKEVTERQRAKVVVFPNPTSEVANIYIKGNSGQWASEPIRITLYNLSGQQLYQESKTLNTHGYTETQLSISHLPPGVYVYTVTSSQAILGRDKIVVE